MDKEQKELIQLLKESLEQSKEMNAYLEQQNDDKQIQELTQNHR